MCGQNRTSITTSAPPREGSATSGLIFNIKPHRAPDRGSSSSRARLQHSSLLLQHCLSSYLLCVYALKRGLFRYIYANKSYDVHHHHAYAYMQPFWLHNTRERDKLSGVGHAFCFFVFVIMTFFPIFEYFRVCVCCGRNMCVCVFWECGKSKHSTAAAAV